MKRRSTRWLALLLSLCMVLGGIPVTGFGASDPAEAPVVPQIQGEEPAQPTSGDPEPPVVEGSGQPQGAMEDPSVEIQTTTGEELPESTYAWYLDVSACGEVVVTPDGNEDGAVTVEGPDYASIDFEEVVIESANPAAPENVTFEAVANPNCRFAGWRVYERDETVTRYTDPILELPYDRDLEIVADFEFLMKPDPTIVNGSFKYEDLGVMKKLRPGAETVGTSSHGDGDIKAVPTEGVWINARHEVRVFAVPDEGYMFSYWTFDPFQRCPFNPIYLSAFGGDFPELASESVGIETVSKTMKMPVVLSAEFSAASAAFTSYAIQGVQEGRDLLTSPDGRRFDEMNETVIHYIHHLTEGENPEEEVINASYETLNDTDRVYFNRTYLGEGSGSHTFVVGEDADCMKIMSEWRYEVVSEEYDEDSPELKALFALGDQISEAAVRQDEAQLDAMGVRSSGDGFEYEVPGYHFYIIREFYEEDPMLTVEVPVGGIVKTSGYDSYQEKIKKPTAMDMAPDTLEYTEGDLNEQTFGEGTGHTWYDIESTVTVQAIPDAGFVFTGWETAEGYTVPTADQLVMLEDCKIKPIFEREQKKRHSRRNRNNTVAETTTVTDEPIALGTLMKQLFIGYPVGDLRMFGNMTRGEYSVVLQRAMAYDTANPAPVQVADALENWYRNEALTALNKGYLTLDGDSRFNGSRLMTANELVASLSKAFGKEVTLKMAEGVTDAQVAKLLKSDASDFAMLTDSKIPLGVPTAGDQPVSRDLVARLLYALLYPVE